MVLFTSKADVLSFLQLKLKKSKIEKMLYFTEDDWMKDKKIILKSIQDTFGNKKIIIRSSAVGEDSVDYSGAGQYTSILNIKPSLIDDVTKSIKSVIDSYHKNGNTNPKNQILIQHQTNNIKTSGVIFTRTNDNGSPYYVINFEEGSSTEGVTHGKIGNTIKIFRNTRPTKSLKKWIPLLHSVKEIEIISNSSFLDIEFGITKSNQVTIFQVRPLTAVRKLDDKRLDNKISYLIDKNKRYFSHLMHSSLYPHSMTIFSDMADWNPSEIIGSNPKPLDYSLYDYLIMEKSWSIGRHNIGYQNVNSKLMKKFGNKPYVDVRASFNSLIPNKIEDKLKKKLMDYYLKKLAKNHNLHDKVEFDVLFTCYDFTLDDRLKELLKYNFTKNEIHAIKTHLLDFTNKIINSFPKILQENDKKIKSLQQNRELVLSNIKDDYKSTLDAAKNLLDNCKTNGTVPFATMARIAFISTMLLKSLSSQKSVGHSFYDQVMGSITTILTEFRNDFDALNKNKLQKSQFLLKYGHLRPGTYDISQLRYDNSDVFFDSLKFFKHTIAKPDSTKMKLSKTISKILENHSVQFNKIGFLDFIQDSLSQREKLKFLFTKNLSDALELIAKAGKELGFSRDELGFLTINDVFDHNKYGKSQLVDIWKKKISKRRAEKLLCDYLNLPPLISSTDDFDLIKYYDSKPNFVTKKSITADIVFIENNTTDIPEMSKKIVILENADPGFDWIFTKNPHGLITKYGGAASHMAIRCAELGLPAAIGCGDVMFNRIKQSSKIMLDCKNHQVLILQQANHDEYVEEKKLLKSLGYIK